MPDALRDTRAADVQWREHGFGPWAVLTSGSSSSAAPSCSRRRRHRGHRPDEVEAGWWVTEDRRNDGIATSDGSGDRISSAAPTRADHGVHLGRGTNIPPLAAQLGFSVRGRGHGRSGEPMTVYTLPRDLAATTALRQALEEVSPGPVFGNDDREARRCRRAVVVAGDRCQRHDPKANQGRSSHEQGRVLGRRSTAVPRRRMKRAPACGFSSVCRLTDGNASHGPVFGSVP